MKISFTLFPQKIHSRIFLGIKKIFNQTQASGEKIKPLFKNGNFIIKEPIHIEPGAYELTGWFNCGEKEGDLGSMNLTIGTKQETPYPKGKGETQPPQDDFDEFFKE